MKGKKVAVAAGVVAGLGGIALILLSRKSSAAPPEEPEDPEPGMAKLYGRVTNSQTGNGIAGVKVTTTGAITMTDSAGDYDTNDIPPGTWGVRFEKDGYETLELDVTIEEGNNELSVQLVPEGGEEPPPEEGVSVSEITLNPTVLDGGRYEYETSLGLGYWGDQFTIGITFDNPFDFDVWVKPDFAFGQLNGETLEFVEETQQGPGGGTELVLHGFEAEELLYFRLLLNSAYIQGDYSYTTTWQKPYDAKGQNTGTNMEFVYDPDGVPRAGDERWIRIPAGGSVTMVKDAHLGDDLSQAASKCVLCGEIIEGSVEQHFVDNHPEHPVTCWHWGGYGGCYFNDGSGQAIETVYVPKPGIEGLHDLCVVAWRAIYFVYDQGCGQTRVGGQIVTLNWRLEELTPIAAAMPDFMEIVQP